MILYVALFVDNIIMCRAVTAGDRLRARGDVAVYVSVRVNHVSSVITTILAQSTVIGRERSRDLLGHAHWSVIGRQRRE